MTDAYAVYLDVLDKVNKEESGYLPADLFNRLAQVASRFVFNDYQSRLQNPATAAIEKGEIKDRLHFCIRNIPQQVSNGFFYLPPDYGYYSAAKIWYDGGKSITRLNELNALICAAENDPTINVAEVQDQITAMFQENFVDIELLDNEQVGKRLNSYIPGKRPSNRKPIMERVTKGFQVYPRAVASVIFWYYHRPIPGVLAMKQTPALGLDYDPANSTAFEWEQESLNDLIHKIANDFSIYIRERDLFQMTAINIPQKITM